MGWITEEAAQGTLEGNGIVLRHECDGGYKTLNWSRLIELCTMKNGAYGIQINFFYFNFFCKSQ